ncbi:MAG: N-(5'-phosphoribosyl)anthranilate isomerase [Paracoccaceae bacterium]|jgi:hypothetical protein
MINAHLSISPQEWLRREFDTRAVTDGGTIRRKVADIERIVGCETLMSLMRELGFRAAENVGHFVIFCNADPVPVRP